MRKTFYIFRHGETDWNKERRCQGHTNIPLNDNGIKQALELSVRLQNLKIDSIYSSDLDRASKTGNIVADVLKVPIFFDHRLREMSYGKAEGMIFTEAIKIYGEELWQKLQSFKREYDHVGFPEGETRKIARDRFSEVINEIIHSSDDEVVAISTHGGALRNFLHFYLPEDQAILPIPNCVVYKFYYDYIEEKIIVEI